jgi:hypothetical protein
MEVVMEVANAVNTQQVPSLKDIKEVPSLCDMKSVYELAAQIAVIDRWNHEHNADCHLTTVSELLDEVEEQFCTFEQSLGHSTPDLDELGSLSENERIDRWIDAQHVAVRALNDFAERYIVLATMRGDLSQFFMLQDVIEAYFAAAKAVAAVQGLQCGCRSLDEEAYVAEMPDGDLAVVE